VIRVDLNMKRTIGGILVKNKCDSLELSLLELLLLELLLKNTSKRIYDRHAANMALTNDLFYSGRPIYLYVFVFLSVCSAVLANKRVHYCTSFVWAVGL